MSSAGPSTLACKVREFTANDPPDDGEKALVVQLSNVRGRRDSRMMYYLFIIVGGVCVGIGEKDERCDVVQRSWTDSHFVSLASPPGR